MNNEKWTLVRVKDIDKVLRFPSSMSEEEIKAAILSNNIAEAGGEAVEDDFDRTHDFNKEVELYIAELMKDEEVLASLAEVDWQEGEEVVFFDMETGQFLNG